VGTARPLSVAFFDGAGRPGAAPDAGLEAALAGAVARARGAFPEIQVDDDGFAAFLGARVPPEGLATARVEDLWVACGCAAGEPRALAAIEARYFPDVDVALGKMGLSAERRDEVKQGLRRLLFVGDAAAPARIAEYRGTGDLRAWLRVTAMRAALKLLRKEGRETPASDDAILEARTHDDDPELAYMKAAYRASFRAAFQEALESLHPKERTLLKQQIVDGLGIDELGALYQVHRATAARWVTSAREKLLGRTRRTFMLRARISSDECESIMRMVRSQLDVSLHRRLAAS
jgi:RNA polymerase sigma-70 factor (ECF subfamily)